MPVALASPDIAAKSSVSIGERKYKLVPVAELHRAYSRGRYAKMNGWERLTPYTCEPKNHYWLRGYDGLPMEAESR